jgi:hypothetical protein
MFTGVMVKFRLPLCCTVKVYQTSFRSPLPRQLIPGVISLRTFPVPTYEIGLE